MFVNRSTTCTIMVSFGQNEKGIFFTVNTFSGLREKKKREKRFKKDNELSLIYFERQFNSKE